MSQPQQMNMGGMGGMGGPVGGAGDPMQQQQNIGTPNSTAGLNGTDYIKRLNTAIYDYLLRNQLYDVARSFIGKMEIEADIKKSPGQGGNQANGADNMDIDSKEIRDRPDDLPAPAQLGDGPFLQDWWCQFWELYHGHRGKGKQNTLNYIGAQRQAQKARNGVMGNMGMGMMPQMNNGMMQPDLKRAAMQQNQQRNMTPQQAAQMQNLQANKQNAMIQGANMERQGSQMDMSGQRTGSPNSGDAPSPKRPRIDGGNMQQMNQQRPGGPQGQMQGNPSVETYSQSIGQSMKAAMTQANSNVNKGMPPNAQMGPGGQQGSPMSQAGMDGATGEFYAAAAANGRMGNMPNANAAGNQAGAGSGNHALQDYQMQLMLLEQQNKKRLLMARQEQDSMSQPGQVGPNGQFGGTGMSPQGSRQGDPSPNPNDMQRGTPKIGKNGMSPNGDLAGRGSPQPGTMMNPQMPQDLQRQMAMQNGGAMMRPPSSHPMGQLTPDQMRMYQQQQQQMMQNGGWQQGQPPPGQMMPGQQPGMPGGPQGQGPPNMTPRQANQQMPPPPAPASGTQPSSPQQPAAPPTPNQTAKPKPGTKKETAKKAANKKGAANATPATESEQPPTPTPAAPMTPMNQNFQNQNKNMPNGQPQPNQQNNNNNQANNNNAVQAPNQQPDMSQPFGSLGDDQFGMNLEFADLQGGDVLDNFDFDSFLNTNDGDAGFGFDANLAFGDGSIEAGGDLGGN